MKKNLKYVKLFENFLKRNHRYKLIANTESDILDALKWFRSNFDITNGFINAASFGISGYEDGTLLKYEVIKDHKPQFIKKTERGYEIEIGLFNYDGKILSDNKWDLEFIHKHMKNDNIKAKIVKINEPLREGKSYGTSGEEAPSWTKTIDGKKTTITVDDIQNYLDKNKVPVTKIPTKDIFNLCAHKGKKDKKTLDRSERSNLDYPILVAKKDNEFVMILDGHHRLLKAHNNDIDKIKARVIDLDKAPTKYQKMFG